MTYSYGSSFNHTPPHKRKEVKFTPSDDQVETAKRRILAVFVKFGGALRAATEAELVRILGREVHNRGRQLGDYHNGDFTITLRAAVRSAVRSGDIVRTDGWYGSVAKCHKKAHHQKYPNRSSRKAAKRAAA